jgi:hypothetical protein
MGFVVNGNGQEITINFKNIEGIVPSDPPAGKLQVKNLYINPETGRLEVEYEDTPVTE